MMVVKCDLCKGEVGVRPWFLTMKGAWKGTTKVDVEANMDICDDCSRRLSNAIEARDTKVRSAVAMTSPSAPTPRRFVWDRDGMFSESLKDIETTVSFAPEKTRWIEASDFYAYRAHVRGLLRKCRKAFEDIGINDDAPLVAAIDEELKG